MKMMNMRKKMTEEEKNTEEKPERSLVKIFLVISIILVLLLFSFGIVYMLSINNEAIANKEIANYNARKEELLNDNSNLANLIRSLNSTLTNETANLQKLESQLANLTGQKTTTTNPASTTSTMKTTTTTATTTTKRLTTTTRRRTRAS